MKYKGKPLILDTFRYLLRGYSVDIQDIVRSAILDDVDIVEYIEPCKENPFRLDQIRLCLKDGISSKFFILTNGESLYKIRKLKKDGRKIKFIEDQLNKGILSQKHIDYILKWVNDGVNISKLDINIIPESLLSTFDYGLCSGFDMSVFNTGVSYSHDYLMSCLHLMESGIPIDIFLSGEWSVDVLMLIQSFSKATSSDKINKIKYLIRNIDCNCSLERVKLAYNLARVGISLEDLMKKEKDKYVYEDECLAIVYTAYVKKLDYKRLITSCKDGSAKNMKILFDEMLLSSHKKISGRLTKN